MTLEHWKQLSEGLSVVLAILSVQGWLMFRDLDAAQRELKREELERGRRRVS